MQDRRNPDLPANVYISEKIFEALPEPCCLLDRKLRIVRANRAFFERTGSDPDNAPGTFCYNIWKCTEEACAICPALAALKSGRREEARIDRGEGGYWRVLAVPLSEEEPELGVLEIAYDLTEARERELLLEQQKLKYQMLYEKSPNPYQSLNADGCFIDVNPAWLSTLAYERDQVIGRWFGDFLVDEYRESFRRNFAEFKRRGSVKGVQFEMIKGDGLSIRVAFDGCIGYSSDTRELCTYCVFKDISLEYEARRALEAAMEREMELNRKKSTFMANVSHELRTPLNGILGFASLLHSHTGDPTAAEYLASILESGEKLLDIIESLLTLSDIERRKQGKTVRRFSLVHMARSLVAVYEADRENRPLSYSVMIDKKLKELTGESESVGRILNHLLSNASKFSDGGEVRCEAFAGQSGLELHVIDQGAGIPEEEREKVFESFYQSEEAITRRHGGMGIGLTIVKEELALLGGTIRIASPPGGGTDMHVSIPWSERLRLSDDEEPAAVSRTTVTKRVLIAEDESINRLFLTVLLKKAGHAVIQAVNGKEAVEKAAAEKPDIILMDLSMPVMDGMEAARLIQADPATAPIPVIAVTAYDSDEYRRRCEEAGMSGFIAKPVQADRLLSLIAELTSAG